MRLRNMLSAGLILLLILTTGCSAGPGATTNEQKEPVNNSEEVQVEIPAGGNTAERLNPQSGGADKEASTLRESILNTKDELKTDDGTVYYISAKNGKEDYDGKSKETPWDSLDTYSMYRSELQPGDTVLLERGGVYRGTMTLISGVHYGAYGDGPKPAIYGSLMNYSGEGIWIETETKNVWRCNEYIVADAGVIVFNHGQAVGVKKNSAEELKQNFDFYHDMGAAEIYLYLEQDPYETFYDIEICEKTNLLQGPANAEDVIIDNLCIKYGGAHGIHFPKGANNVKITNCEMGWIGGSIMNDQGTRFGNAIEFWNSCSNITVENNWIYQIYDAGITHQGGQTVGNVQTDISYKGNLVEYCTYGIEYFAGDPKVDTMKNITFADNILRFAGHGWGVVRTNPQKVSLINGWGGEGFAIENFVIKNNIFDVSDNFMIVQYYNADMNIEYTGNTYYQKKGFVADWEFGERLEAEDQKSLEESVSKFDSNPKLVKFLE